MQKDTHADIGLFAKQNETNNTQVFIHFWCGRNCFVIVAVCDLELHVRIVTVLLY